MAITVGEQSIEESLMIVLASAVTSARRHPLYEQLAAAIEQAIAGGLLGAGTALPREPEFAQRLGLSRQTVSKALTLLAQRGLIVRRRGIGTFVAQNPIEQPLDRLYSFVRTLAVGGQPPASRLLGARLISEPDIAQALGLPPDELVFELSRLFSIDDAPFAYERIYLPAEFSERLPHDRLAMSVIYELLRECCDIVVTHGEETMRIASLARPDASLLRLPSGDPAFLVERLAYAGERLVELRRTFVRGDRTRFRVRLAGPFLIPQIESAS